MKKILFALLALGAVALAPASLRTSLAARAYAGTNSGAINAADSSGGTKTPSAGSYVSVGIGPGDTAETIEIRGAWSGTLQVYTCADGTNRTLVPSSNLLNLATNDTNGITSGATGRWRVQTSGDGYLWIVATSWNSGSATIRLTSGEAGGAPSPNSATNPQPVVDSTLPVNENPLTVAVYDVTGSGSTVTVEYCDANGVTLPLADTAGGLWPDVAIAIPASSARGLSYAVLQCRPDGTHAIATLPSGAAYLKIRCTAGSAFSPSVSINTGGLVSGAAGTAGNGCNTGYAPDANAPIQLYLNDYLKLGRAR